MVFKLISGGRTMFDLAKYKMNIAGETDEGETITYQELEKFSEKVAQFVPERKLVFSLCRNGIGSLAGYVSFLNNKIVPLLLADSLNKELLDNLFATYQPEYVWAPEEYVFDNWKCIYKEYKYCLYKTDMLSPPLYEELALLLTTSGSTGSPKLVRQSYKNILANTKSIIQYLNITETERPITTLPMNYTYGLSIVNTHLYAGAKILLTDRAILQKEFWEFFVSAEATSFGGVPYTYEMLNRIRFFEKKLLSLKTMTQAGGKLTPELHKKFAEYAAATGKSFVVMYGQTEATARMAYLPAEKSIEKYGSMGIAIPGGTFELVDVDNKEIEQSNVVGELVYKGDNVTLGYAQCGKDLENGDERNGILFTGDMAKRDAQGYYYIVGRKKRFLKIFGNRVNLDELEQILKTHDTELDCACTGVDDRLCIYLANAKEECFDEIKEFLMEKTGLNKSTFRLKNIDKIPKNDSGKTLYSDLKVF